MYAYCQEMPGVFEEMATKVDKEVGEAPVAGLIAHVAGPTAVGWRIIDIWESEEDYHRFVADRLNPALQIATTGADASQPSLRVLPRHRCQRALPARLAARIPQNRTRPHRIFTNLELGDHSFRQHFIQDSVAGRAGGERGA